MEKPFNWSSELAGLPGLPDSNHLVTPQTVTIQDIPTSLKPEHFNNEDIVEASYYSEIENLLWKERADLTAIAVLGHQLGQLSDRMFVNDYLRASSIWRVLKGPSDDWTLALCDYRSVDVEHDTVANDIVVAHGSGSVENSLLYYDQRHEWFYKSDMEVDDIIMFRQTDSSGAMPSETQRRATFVFKLLILATGAWHASFNHPSTSTSPFVPRESIGV
ncbi:8cb51d38-37e5-4b3e-8cad-3d6bbc0c8fb8 [Sclerotinia trifoliorum]|uniref:8cb51d38-37e5-4b3e-8cad-3d6bbc0c8fb8 n=1 Tax=Sclerotinia trifoliorum TaxID=28548 RepID=A0A8H2VMW7_9HELO|nr:8cb51d38-37e5-4b3e-8cad-3d6bbc0c8fb8 [Sclerotinia trifoliorum]